MTGLFVREPETLDGYVPKFSEEESKLYHKVERRQIGGGFKDMDFDRDNIEYRDIHSIKVLELRIEGTQDSYRYRGNPFDAAAEIANEFIANKEDEQRHPAEVAWLRANAKDLNNSKRYWSAWNHRIQIEKTREEAQALFRQVKRAEVMASVNALEVKAERSFSSSERQVFLAEFNGGEFSDERAE